MVIEKTFKNLPYPEQPGPFFLALVEKGSYRKAGQSLGLSKTQFTIRLKKELNLCIHGTCLSPPKADCTRCDFHIKEIMRTSDPVKRKENSIRYREENRELVAKKQLEWQRANREWLSEYGKAYRKTDKGVLIEHRRYEKRTKRKKELEDDPLAVFDYIMIKILLKSRCFKCQTKLKLTLDHHLALVRSGRLTVGNTVLLCRSCNSSKKAKLAEDFYTPEELAKIHEFFEVCDRFKKETTPKAYTFKVSEYPNQAVDFIKNYHYLKSCPSPIYSFELRYEHRVLGVCIFSTPTNLENYTSDDSDDRVLELTRLYIVDGTPKNTESYFIAKCLNWIKTQKKWHSVISFADPDRGHAGTIYKASNFEYIGLGKPNYHYVDPEGKEHNKRAVFRQGKSLGLTEADFVTLRSLTKVKESPKHKYRYLLGEPKAPTPCASS